MNVLENLLSLLSNILGDSLMEGKESGVLCTQFNTSVLQTIIEKSSDLIGGVFLQVRILVFQGLDFKGWFSQMVNVLLASFTNFAV